MSWCEASCLVLCAHPAKGRHLDPEHLHLDPEHLHLDPEHLHLDSEHLHLRPVWCLSFKLGYTQLLHGPTMFRCCWPQLMHCVIHRLYIESSCCTQCNSHAAPVAARHQLMPNTQILCRPTRQVLLKAGSSMQGAHLNYILWLQGYFNKLSPGQLLHRQQEMQPASHQAHDLHRLHLCVCIYIYICI